MKSNLPTPTLTPNQEALIRSRVLATFISYACNVPQDHPMRLNLEADIKTIQILSSLLRNAIETLEEAMVAEKVGIPTHISYMDENGEEQIFKLKEFHDEMWKTMRKHAN